MQGNELTLNTQPDSEVIRRMQHGDRHAVELFYRRYVGALWRFIYARLPLEADACDVLAETFLAAIRDIQSANPDAPASCWLIGIARHKVADHHRRQYRQRSALEEVAQRPTSLADSVVAMVESVERQERLLAALAAMADEDRSVLEWKYLEDLSVRQIAGRTSRSEKSIESMLYRARNVLRQLLEPCESEKGKVEP